MSKPPKPRRAPPRGRHKKPPDPEASVLDHLRRKHPRVVEDGSWDEHCLYPVLFETHRAIREAKELRAQDDPECANWLHQAEAEADKAEDALSTRDRMEAALSAYRKAAYAQFCAPRRGRAALLLGRAVGLLVTLPAASPYRGDWPARRGTEYAHRWREREVGLTGDARAEAALNRLLHGRTSRRSRTRWADREWNLRWLSHGR